MIFEIRLWPGVLIAKEELKVKRHCYSYQISSTNIDAELEALLIVTGALHPPERRAPEDRQKESSSDEEDLDSSSHVRSTATSTNGRKKKNVRGKDNDSDSEFDFDL